MARFRLLQRLAPPKRMIDRPFADWFADVTVRIERRTGSWRSVNLMSSAYWQGLYHSGVSAYVAADDFIADSRNVL
jgi:hypothetical protein